jgi:hypothetical protein
MLSNQVRECLRYVEDCMEQAARQSDPKLRRDYLIIGACWLKLIRELSELPISQKREFTQIASMELQPIHKPRVAT